MSRYTVPACDPRLSVIVGWDNPLATFFGQVFDGEKEEEDEECCVLWVGTTPEEVRTVEALHAGLQPFVCLPEELVAYLRADQQQRHSRSPLQDRVVQWLAGVPGASSPARDGEDDDMDEEEYDDEQESGRVVGERPF